MGYRPALDGLRAFAVIAVVLFHATSSFSWQYKGGFLGVDVFFVISGCLITLLLLAEHERTHTVSLPAFYGRRALRLLPALVLTIVWVGVAIEVTGWRGGQSYVKSAVEALFYVANWASLQGAKSPLGYLTHTWSLSIEEQFYLIWPGVLLLLLRRRVSRRHLLAGVTALIALVVVVRAAGWLAVGGVAHYRFFYLSTVTRADCILVGVALGIAVTDDRLRARLRWADSTAVAAAAAGALVLVTFTTRVVSGWYYLGGATVVALLAAVLVAHGLSRDSGPVASVLAWKPLVHVGRRSYGLYLVHLPLIVFLSRANNEWVHARGSVFVLAAIVASLVAAEASWTLVERPFLLLKDRRLEPPRADVVPVRDEQPWVAPAGVVPSGEAAR